MRRMQLVQLVRLTGAMENDCGLMGVAQRRLPRKAAPAAGPERKK
jgi:hypothetical protein